MPYSGPWDRVKTAALILGLLFSIALLLAVLQGETQGPASAQIELGRQEKPSSPSRAKSRAFDADPGFDDPSTQAAIPEPRLMPGERALFLRWLLTMADDPEAAKQAEAMLRRFPHLARHQGSRGADKLLLILAAGGHADAMALLLKHGTDPIDIESIDKNPLYHLGHGSFQFYYRLYEEGEKLDSGEYPEPPADCLARLSGPEAQWMLQGLSVTVRLKTKETHAEKSLLVTHYEYSHDRNSGAIYTLERFVPVEDDLRVVDLLLKHGADVNADKGRGYAPLHEALRFSRPEVVVRLIEGGADLYRYEDYNGQIPVYAIAYWGTDEMIRAMVRQGADLHYDQIKSGETPLHCAVESAIASRRARAQEQPERYRGNPNAPAVMLELGADPNIANHEGITPLHRAVDAEDLETVELLLAYGADPNRKDDWGRTPMALAQHRSKVRDSQKAKQITELLRRHGGLSEPLDYVPGL